MADDTKKQRGALVRTEPPAAPSSASSLSPRILEQFIENQGRELELRAQELVFQREQSAQQHEIAKASINAQLTDRKDERLYHGKETTKVAFLVGLVILSVVTVIVYSIHAGKPEIAIEVIKAIIFLVAGGAGGYAVGSRRSSKDKDDVQSK